MVKSDYVAYHNVEKMGEYRRGRGEFVFFSKKHRKFLENIAGSHVWVITGERDTARQMVYRLAAVFVASGLQQYEDGWQVTGVHGVRFATPILLNARPWFDVLYREQNNFSFGVSRIRSEDVIAELSNLQRKTRMEVRSKAGAKTQRPSPKLQAVLMASDLYPQGKVRAKRK